MTKELWEEVFSEIKVGGAYEEYLPFIDVFKDLGNGALTLDKLHDAVIWLLNEINK